MSFITNIVGAGSGISTPVFVPNSSNASAGMVAVPAGNPALPDQITVATTSARLNYNAPAAIYAASATAGFFALVYLPGARIPTSVTGLGVGAYDTTVVVTSTGTLVRKDVPAANDMVVGTVDTNGILHFVPILPTGYSDAANPGLRAAEDFSGAAGDIIQRRIDSAVLSAGIFQLEGASAPIQLEPGVFALDHPLHIWVPHTQFRAAGIGATNLVANNWAGPMLFVSPRREPPFLALNDFAGGNAMILDSPPAIQNSKWFEISEAGAGSAVDGWTQFEVEFIIKKTQAGTYGFGGTVISSSGSRYASDAGSPVGDTTLQTAYYVNLTSGTDGTAANSVLFQIATSVSSPFVFAPAASLPVDGNYHRVKCNYDGSNMRIIIDNVVVATQAATGTMKQRKWEMVNIGRGISYIYNNALDTNCPFANLASIQIRDAVSQTTSGTLTLPTTKLTYPPVDSHVTFITNFDDFYPSLQTFIIASATNANPVIATTTTPHGLNPIAPFPVFILGALGNTAINGTWPNITVIDGSTISIPVAGNGAYTANSGKMIVGGTFVKGFTRPTFAGNGWVQSYYPTYHDDPGTATLPRVNIEDIALESQYGDAIVGNQTIKLLGRNIYARSKGGIRMRDNCFEFRLTDFSLITTALPADRRPGIVIGAAAYMGSLANFDISGYDVGIVAANSGDLTLNGTGYLVVCRQPLVAYGLTTLQWYGDTDISDEGGTAGTADIMVSLIGCANVYMTGVQMAFSGNSVQCIAIDQVNPTTLDTQVNIEDCFFVTTKGPDVASRTAPGLIRMLAGHGNPAVGACMIRSKTRPADAGGGFTPWIDPASDAAFPIMLEEESRIRTRTININGLTTYTMTRDDCLYSTVIFTGALAGTCAVTTPALNLGAKYFIDATTGVSAVVTLVAAGGTNVLTVPKTPAAVLVRYDGTNVRNP